MTLSFFKHRLSKFILCLTPIYLNDGARLLSDVAEGLILTSGNISDFHSEIWMLLPNFSRHHLQNDLNQVLEVLLFHLALLLILLLLLVFLCSCLNQSHLWIQKYRILLSNSFSLIILLIISFANVIIRCRKIFRFNV